MVTTHNVPGAFSSNKGADFKAVLEAIIGIVEPETKVPAPDQNRWPYADVYLGGGWSVAYRILSAEHWGVPQRRKRIYLVGDLNGESAGKILFKSEGLSGYSAESFREWQRAAKNPAAGFGAAGRSLIVLNDQGGQRMDVSEDVTGTLRAQSNGHPPLVMAAGFCTEHSANSRSIGYEEETSPTLRAGVVPAALAIESNPTDSRVKISETGVIQTLTQRMGTGGNNTPLVAQPEPVTLKIRAGCAGGGKGPLLQHNKSATLGCNNDQTLFQPETYDVRFTSDGTKNARGHCYKTDISRCLDTAEADPDSNHGGVCVVEEDRQQAGRQRADAPAFSSTVGNYMTNSEEVAQTLMARDYKDPQIVTTPSYVVRRLTPTECARLQGAADWWCQGLETDNPSEDDIAFWTDVFEVYRQTVTKTKRPKTRNQIVKWLKNPYRESAEYRMWGNAVAVPCAWFVLAGIVWAEQGET